MQKIIIKNFGAVENAEIDLKKVLIFIGEQASGKSTIAKLIYFFKSLADDLTEKMLFKHQSIDYFDLTEFLISVITNKFYNFFGFTLHLPNFEIIFYYSVEKDRHIKLTLAQDKKLNPEFSDSFLNDSFNKLFKSIKEFFQEKPENFSPSYFYSIGLIQNYKEIAILVNELFENNQTNLLFVIAGRNATVRYSESFEDYLFASVKNILRENSKQPFDLKIQTIDETLMLKFMERSAKIKDAFKKLGNFKSILENIEQPEHEHNKNRQDWQQYLKNIELKINKILKGKYIIDNSGEKIVFDRNSQNSVYLNNASSGQQESIRILQDIFLNIYHNEKNLRIIEEPEAHLFPVAQKELIELLALMVNQNEENQLIITTHSPYILTVFNNLLFAKGIVEKNPLAESEVTKIIPKEYWLNLDDFSAYSLSNEPFDEETNYCESIFSREVGMIEPSYLDTVSEILEADFHQLYSIYPRSSVRR